MALDAVQLLAELVACPSPNPRRAPLSDLYPGEAGLQALLARILTGLGAKVRLEEVLPGRSNLLAFFPGRDAARTLLLDAHADTVPQDGMSIAPFTPEIRNGRMYGRGTTDTKGGMAAMLAALSRVAERKDGFPCTICFAATCNEENGADGAHALMRAHRGDFTAAVVAEPTDLAVIHTHKGVLRFAIETRGLAAHTSLPERGVSAIYAMTHIIRRIEGSYRQELSRRTHPLLDSPRVTVGLIQGGTQVNIVPDRCVIEVDRRTLPGESLEMVQQEFDRLLAACRSELDPAITFSCKPTEIYPPLHEPVDSPLCKLAAEACRRTLGQAVLSTAPFGTDAGVFAANGLPSVVLGPGSIAQAHTADEFIELSAVSQAVDVYETLIGLAGQTPEAS